MEPSFRAVVLSDQTCGCGGQSVRELESHGSHEKHSTCLAREGERQGTSTTSTADLAIRSLSL